MFWQVEPDPPSQDWDVDWEGIWAAFFAKPEPSLCDRCRHAYMLGGGAVSVGGKTYPQRYCDKTVSQDQLRTGRSISVSGYQECEFFEVKPIQEPG